MKKRPEISITSIDAEKLYDLIETIPTHSFAGKAELESELSRANVVAPQLIAPTIVTMNSTVRFAIESTNDEFELTLVYPKDVGKFEKSISILAPVGSALLGLSVGDKIEWPKPAGGVLKVVLKDVTYQPERNW